VAAQLPFDVGLGERAAEEGVPGVQDEADAPAHLAVPAAPSMVGGHDLTTLIGEDCVALLRNLDAVLRPP